MDKKRNIRTVVFRESGGSGRKDSVNSNHVRLLNEQINITTWARSNDLWLRFGSTALWPRASGLASLFKQE